MRQMRIISFQIFLLLQFNLAMGSQIPYSPLNNYVNNIYTYDSRNGKHGEAKMIITTTKLTKTIRGEKGLSQIDVAWVLNGKPMTDDPDEFFETKTGIIWIDKQFAFKGNGEQLSSSPYFKRPSKIEILSNGDNWVFKSKKMGPWKKMKITMYTGLYTIITVSHSNGLISQENYNKQGLLIDSLKVVR